MNSIRTNSRHPTRANGFTLLEVLLAASLAAALLFVALHLYQQATHLREQLLEETERVSSLRQLLDRLTNDLRLAQPNTRASFYGEASSLQFVRASLPAASLWAVETTAAHTNSQRLLRQVHYQTFLQPQGTQLISAGVLRREQPIDTVALASRRVSSPTGPATLNRPAPFAASATNLTTPAIAPSTNPLPRETSLAAAVRFLRFRYWAGSAWLDSWHFPHLPAAVEIQCGLDPWTLETDPEEYPFERFRRVVFIPCAPAPLFPVEPPRSNTNASPAVNSQPIL